MYVQPRKSADDSLYTGVRIMGAKAVEALHDRVVSKRDHGMTGMITDFSQGGINFYRYYLNFPPPHLKMFMHKLLNNKVHYICVIVC